MKMLPNRIHLLLAGVVVLVLAGFVACGGGGGGGAAPSDTAGGGVIAVEIPAMGDIAGLPYASGVVVTGSGSLSAPLKSVGKSNSGTNKSVAIKGNPFTDPAMSFQGCKMYNSVGLATEAMLRSDVSKCILDAVAAQETDVDFYSGSDIIFSVDTNGDAPNKYKFNGFKNDDGTISQTALFGCNSSQQSMYQRYRVSGDHVSIYSQGYDPVSQLVRSLVAVDCDVASSDTTLCVDSKTGIFRFYGDTLMTDVDTGTALWTQYPSSVLVNSLFVPGGSQHLVGSADFTNATSGATFDGTAWNMGAGAATFTRYDVTTTGCWEGTAILPVTCLAGDSNFIAMSSETSTTPDILYDVYGFGTDEWWDCQGDNSFTISNYESAVNSCIANFSLNWSEIDCSALDTNTSWLVQATDGSGGSLSTTEGTYTNVTTGAGYLYISMNWAADTSSFSDTTIQLTNLTTDVSETLYSPTWNSDHDQLLLYYGYSSYNYRLTITGGASGVKSASGSALPADKVYYFMVNGGYVPSVNNWSVSSITPSGGNATPSETPLNLDGSFSTMTTNVSTATTSFAITFAEAMDGSTITNSTMTMTCSVAGTVTGTVSVAEAPANTYLFSPDTTFLPLDECTLTVSGGADGVKDSGGATSDDNSGAYFQTGCTTNDDFSNYYIQYAHNLPMSTCWTEANTTLSPGEVAIMSFYHGGEVSGDTAPRESKTFVGANITTTIEIPSASGLSETGDSCGMRLRDPDDGTIGAVIVLKANGSGNILIEKSAADGSGAETFTLVTGGSSFPTDRGPSVYIQLAQSGGNTTAGYRLGSDGGFTSLGADIAVTFGATKRLDLFITGDGVDNNNPVQCTLDNFTASGASANGHD